MSADIGLEVDKDGDILCGSHETDSRKCYPFACASNHCMKVPNACTNSHCIDLLKARERVLSERLESTRQEHLAVSKVLIDLKHDIMKQWKVRPR